MALSRLSSTGDLLTTLSRVSYLASASLGEVQCTRYTGVHENRTKGFHVTSVRRYPDPPTLPLPTNVSEIFANETGRFTPERVRDITTPVLLYGKCTASSFTSQQAKQSIQLSCIPLIREDTHVDSYDCFGAVSLNGSMQSNVPKPFSSSGKSTHLNMPGGQWARGGKYIAEDMQKSHFRAVRLPQPMLNKNGTTYRSSMNSTILQRMYQPRYVVSKEYSTTPPEGSKSLEKDDVKESSTEGLSKRERLKKAVKDYGSTVFVFHIGISLISLFAFYTAVISGLDLMPIVKYFTGGSGSLDKIVNESSSFLLAYTIHKVFAPVRISITLAVTPFLVRYLRRIGLLKPPKIKVQK